MVSERMRRRLEALLDEADAAVSSRDWPAVGEQARAALAIDPDNADALTFLRMAESNVERLTSSPAGAPEAASAPEPARAAQPSSFVAGRYAVRRFLGEGGKKRVFLAHDQLLDRDVAFALIKTDGLDDVGRERIVREAQAMGRIGAHPHVVSVLDLGEEAGAPYIVTELMGGGDVDALLEKASGPLELPRALEIAKSVARGLAFAHQQGVVHRDLKPGNVWLTADGVAKIGDFGLAVALDRSRLTTHGLMVGTVAYMPPEQALGGEVTPQADLYSLGAMLYELVTGKPPFAGDSPTAIISQHINTPPVAPSWHSAHCPPDLETLILRLLAKVPADRPASALEVLAALEAIDPEAPSASHADSSANPLDRLARGVFVGRERELERLRSAFDDAFAGRGSVVMLVGEPGIGKTRTSLELETYARMRGAKVLWGRANESSGAPPYFPWTQLGRAYAAATDDATLTNQLRDYAVELQRLFPGVRNRFPGLPEPPPVEDESAQFRLFDAMSGFYRDVAAQTPLVLVLDDLHWADRPTLALLTHLARELTRARILVVGTYRDTDLDRQHPLSRTLAELNREQLFTRINLRGLTRDEVGGYIRATAQVEPTARLIERVHEETEGNAFFLAEVVNLMAQEGSFEKSSVSDVAIPEGVKEALGRRLDRLSTEANELLSLAAVLGREFDHPQLVAVSGKADDEVLRLVEEALAARVLDETSAVGGYRFTHALMQETLLGELSAARRVRLHGQIGEALDALYANTAEARAPELAGHYLESSALNRAHAQRAARYLRIAAEQAAGQFAWEEVIRHYERCLAIMLESPDRLGQDEPGLWLELAIANMQASSRRPAWDAFDRAFELYTVRADPDDLAHAAVRMLSLAFPAERVEHRGVMDAALAALGAEASEDACRLLALRSVADFGPAGDVDADRAEAMAGILGLTGARMPFPLRSRPISVALDQGRFADAADLAERVAAEATALGYVGTNVIVNGALSALSAGDLDRALELYRRGADESFKAGRRGVALDSEVRRIHIHWRRGWQHADEAALDAIPAGHFEGDLLRAEMSLEAGDYPRAIAALPSDDHAATGAPGPRGGVLAARCRVFVAAGKIDEALVAFGQWWGVYSELTLFGSRKSALPAMDDALCVLGNIGILEAVATFLSSYPAWRYWDNGTGPDYLRGAIALRLDRVNEAEQHFNTGLAWAKRERVDVLVS